MIDSYECLHGHPSILARHISVLSSPQSVKNGHTDCLNALLGLEDSQVNRQDNSGWFYGVDVSRTMGPHRMFESRNKRTFKPIFKTIQERRR